MDLSELVADRRRRNDRRNAHHPLAAELTKAIARGTIEIAFQPQFSASDGALTCAEALARWPHKQFGDMAGDELFAIAELSGLDRRLSAHVRDRALATASDWPDHLRLSLNVTARDLAQPDFAASVTRACEAARFPPERLTLEITEQALVADVGETAAMLAQLAEQNVRIALDDFGAGFCNFAYLKQLPLHVLKLDRSMVHGIAAGGRDLAVFRAIVAMAAALGLEVIAEGIESEEERSTVVREGCSAWQGFLGARPLSTSEFGIFAKGEEQKLRH